MKVIAVNKPEETEKLGESIGRKLKGGEVIELASDLGGGKTTFVRGLARGAGSRNHVSSPTFTISKVYKAPKYNIHHFDFYRLEDAGLMAHEVVELAGDDGVVVAVEWAAAVEHVLPDNRLKIAITSDGDESRLIRIDYPRPLSYLLEDV